MRNVSLAFFVLVLGLPVAIGEAETPDLRIEPGVDGVSRLVIVNDGSGESGASPVGFTRASDVRVTESGRALSTIRWLKWNEDGETFFSVSRDAGDSWDPKRRFRSSLRLKNVDVRPHESMPASMLPLPPSGQLFIVQAKIPWQPSMFRRAESMGCETLSYVHHFAYLSRCEDAEMREALAEESFIERIEPFDCAQRLTHELLRWITRGDPDEPETLRVNLLTTKPDEKEELGRFAREIGIGVLGETTGGSLIDFTVTRDQLRELACHDTVQYAERWLPPEVYMDKVRADTGADWLEEPAQGSHCGTGVRGEILDTGFDIDHQEYADRMVIHGTVDENVSHGTSTFGIVFSAGSVDPLSRGLLPCGTGIAGDSEEVTCTGCSRFDYTRDSQTLYHASFQSNSWGRGPGPEYGLTSHDMDEIIWRLDMAILQAMNNEGKSDPQNVARDAWSKNIISVGAVHHLDTLDTTDDWWCNKDCQTLYEGDEAGCTADPHCEWFVIACVDDYSCGNIGPAEDGRVKPDVSYWYDRIYTTTTDELSGADGYTSSFGGTSASTPEAAGVLGLILEQWADTTNGGVNPWGHSPQGATVFEKQPHASTLKALLINSADQYPFSGTDHDMSRMRQGWGRPNARHATERAARSLVIDEDFALLTGESQVWTVEVAPGETELKATLVYLDPPKTTATGGKELINDLDLRLVTPPDSGTNNVTVYCGNAGLDAGTESTPLWTGLGPADQAPSCDDPSISASRDDLNNVENVFIKEETPGGGITPGLWTIEVSAYELNTDGNPNTECRDVDIRPGDPEAGRAECEAAGCTWDGIHGVCSDATIDVVFALVVTGAEIPASGESNGLVIGKDTDDLVLSWDPDCAGDSTYGIYRGDLAGGYDTVAPEPGQCAVAGLTANVPTGPGTADFFLVVPNTGSSEGSYGIDSNGVRRETAASPCVASQEIHGCAP